MNFTQKEYKELEDKLYKMQEQVIQNEKMTFLGSMMAGITHEISTPIGLGVTGMSHFLSETRKLRKLFDNEEMTQEDFEYYLQSTEKTADIVYSNLFNAKNIIQSFKRVSIDQTSEVKREFELYEYLNEIITSLHNKIKHTKVNVINEVDKGIVLDSYAGSFVQIFTNFIMNSLIHGFKKDEKGNIKITATQDEKYVYIDYSDNGAGISSENIKKIYEPFFTTKADEGGSGLGMQIIRDLIINQLQGTIKVKSEIGDGVLFNIVLPKELA